jgi:hypothetical protein
MTRYFLAAFLRGVGAVSPGYSARMIPILGSMVSPPCSATSINASMAARHAKLSCSRFRQAVLYLSFEKLRCHENEGYARRKARPITICDRRLIDPPSQLMTTRGRAICSCKASVRPGTA